MLFHSAEIRWFFRGTPGEDFNRWFESRGLHSEQDARTDDYLVLPRCATTGIKMREGRFEVKAATSASELDQLPNGMRGYKGTWVKWSRRAEQPDAVRTLITGADEVVRRVQKRRTVRLVSLDGDAPLEVRPDERRLGQGCQVERTLLRVAPSTRALDDAPPWWGLSFEAFGDAEDVIANLDEVTRFLLRDAIGVAASERDSMSYPEWLDSSL